MKKQLHSLKLLYDVCIRLILHQLFILVMQQLISEKSIEKADERRVTILKAQNIQLERQV
jgi:hypothetical protein